MTKVVIVGSSLKIGPAVSGSAGPIPAPLHHGGDIHWFPCRLLEKVATYTSYNHHQLIS